MEEKSLLQQVFEGKKVLTSRPDGMEFADYKMLLNAQNKFIRRVLAGSPDRKLVGLIPQRRGYNVHA